MLYKTSSLTHLSSGSELQRRGMMEVLNYMHTDRKDECEVQQVARTGFQNAERLIQILAQHHSNQQPLQQDCSSAAFEAITSFKKVASLLSRTGHARFRRGPEGIHSSMASFGASFVEAPNFCQPDTTITLNQSSSSASPPSPPQRTSSQVASPAVSGGRIEAKSQQTQQRSNPEMAVVPSFSMDTSGCTAPISSSRSFMSISSMNVEGSVSNGKSLLQQQALPPVWPRPSNSAGVKRKCSGKPEDLSGKCASLGKCHCSKRRKLRLKRTIKVPAISNKLAEIPPDEYSWRKYGQKPIKGSPHPRGYYKCSSMRGCPARKHVERSLDDPTMLTVTYEGEHNHTRTSTAPNSNAMIVHNYEADGNAKPIPTSRALTAANGSIGVNNYEAEHGNTKSISPSNNSSTVVLHS